MIKTLILKVNDFYQIELESHSGAGYVWIIEDNNEDITEVSIEALSLEYDFGNKPIGGSIPIKVNINAKAKGKSKIKLVEKRNWETDIKPINTITINVVVE